MYANEHEYAVTFCTKLHIINLNYYPISAHLSLYLIVVKRKRVPTAPCSQSSEHTTEPMTHGESNARPIAFPAATEHHRPLTGTKLHCLVKSLPVSLRGSVRRSIV